MKRLQKVGQWRYEHNNTSTHRSKRSAKCRRSSPFSYYESIAIVPYRSFNHTMTKKQRAKEESKNGKDRGKATTRSMWRMLHDVIAFSENIQSVSISDPTNPSTLNFEKGSLTEKNLQQCERLCVCPNHARLFTKILERVKEILWIYYGLYYVLYILLHYVLYIIYFTIYIIYFIILYITKNFRVLPILMTRN